MAISKPTVIPEWARTTGHITTPTSAKQDLGWEYEEDPSSAIENWRTKYVGLWCKWLDERFDDESSSANLKILHPGTGNDALLFFADEVRWTFGASSNYGMNLTNLGVLQIYSSVGGGLVNGAKVRWENPDRTGLAPAQTWEIKQVNATLEFNSYDPASALEYLYLTIEHQLTNPNWKFHSNSRLIPATTQKGQIGTENFEWLEVHTNKLFETSAPYLWAKLSTADIRINVNTWTVITPNDNIQASGLTVEDTTGYLEADSGHEGWYKVDCAILAQATVAATDLSLAIYRNGTKIPDSQINNIHLPDTEPRLIPFTFLARLDAASDYIELYGWHNKGITAFVDIKIGSQLTAVRCRKVHV